MEKGVFDPPDIYNKSSAPLEIACTPPTGLPTGESSRSVMRASVVDHTNVCPVCGTAYSKGNVVGPDNPSGQHFFLFILLLFMFRVVHVPVLFSLCSLVHSSNVDGGVHAAV